MNQLRTSAQATRETIAFILVPAWVYAARADLKEMVEKNIAAQSPMQTPFITHWLHNIHEDRVMNFIHHAGFTNTADETLHIIFVPCYLDGNDGIFNVSYYDLLIGMDATVYPSYYEPWGYTPLESIAFGVPTITTDLAGFGLWAKHFVSGHDMEEGVGVVARTYDNYQEVVQSTASLLLSLMQHHDSNTVREHRVEVATKTEWTHFIKHYYTACDIALRKKKK